MKFRQTFYQHILHEQLSISFQLTLLKLAVMGRLFVEPDKMFQRMASFKYNELFLYENVLCSVTVKSFQSFINYVRCLEGISHKGRIFRNKTLYISNIYFCKLRDGSLITSGDGVEDILMYFMESLSPAQIYIRILAPTPVLQKKLHTPFIFHPTSL